MRKFLASVGTAKLLGKSEGKYVHIADIRTLTESTLSFSTTMEEVRAGEGAQLYGRFAHDSGMTVTLTDAMFDLSYVAMQVGKDTKEWDIGAGFNSPEDPTLMQETVFGNNETRVITLKQVPQNIGSACNLDHKMLWIRKKGCTEGTEWAAIELIEGELKEGVLTPSNANYDSTTRKVILPATVVTNGREIALKKGDTVCVQYFVNKYNSRSLKINANFFPSELILILTTKLYAGDYNHPETGKPVGEITVKIPRFQLDGTFDLSMAMSAAATVALNGTALAVDDGSCDGAGVYAEIVEVIDTENSSIMDTLSDIVIDPDSAITGEVPVVYGKFSNGAFGTIDNFNFKMYGTTNGFNYPLEKLGASGTTGYIVVYDGQHALPTTGTIELKERTKYTVDNKDYYYYAESAVVIAAPTTSSQSSGN